MRAITKHESWIKILNCLTCVCSACGPRQLRRRRPRGARIANAGEPQGPLRIVSSARLGQQIVAPALSRMKSRYPGVEVWLELKDRRIDLIGEGFHVDIRAGDV